MYTGPLYPGTTSDVGDGDGTGWTNTNNIKVDDGTLASGDISGGGYFSGGITATNFGLAISTSLQINGIEVEIERVGSAVTDFDVHLMKSGGATSSNQSTGAFANGTITFGGPTDLWGFTSLSPSDVNNSAFGVYYGAKNISGGGTIELDYIRMTVYFGPTDKPYDSSIRKVFHAKVYRAGVYLGLLPNIYDDFEFTDEVNTAGSDMTISVATVSDTAFGDVTSSLDDESGDPILTEDSDPILSESSSSIVGIGGESGLIANGNTVVMYEYSPYYPNGYVKFRGRIDKWNDANNRISVNLKSDGQDFDNSVLVGPPYTYVVDQSQTTSSGTSNLDETIGYERDGQTFTTGSTFTALGGIILKFNPSATRTITVNVYSSPIMDHLLGTSAVTIASTGGTPTEVTFPFAPRIAVTPSTQYFFTVQIDAGTLPIHYNSAGGYADGERYHASYSGGSGGGSYAVVTGEDLYFKTAESVGATSVSYSSQDPTGSMLPSAMDDYIGGGGLITYTDDSIDDSGYSVPYDFKVATMLETVDKIHEMAPSNFYWFVDRGTNLLTMKAASATPDFILIRGRHIVDMQVTISIENVKNIVYFSGGEVTAGVNLYKIYQDATSVNLYGPRVYRISDSRVTIDATADAIGGSALAQLKDEQYYAEVEVADTTMDVSLLRPGKTVGFVGFQNYKDTLVLQIVRRNVKAHSVILTLGIIPPRQTENVEKISRQLLVQQTVANPDTPS